MLKQKLKLDDWQEINNALHITLYFYSKMGEKLIAIPSSSGGILFTYGVPVALGLTGLTAAGLGLKSLLNSNNPVRMSTEMPSDEKLKSMDELFSKENKSLLKQAWDWTTITGNLIGCTLRDWFSEQSPECAAFRQRAKNDGGIYSQLTSLTSWTKGLLIGGVSLAVVIPLIKLAFDRYARTGTMNVVQPKIKPEIKPEFNPEIKPEFKNEVKPEVKPEFKNEVNPNFKLDYDPDYDPDYNPNLLQNYVPTINVNTTKQQPQMLVQPRGTVFVEYEPGYKSVPKIKNKTQYDWLFE